jgi:hypothetical protein
MTAPISLLVAVLVVVAGLAAPPSAEAPEIMSGLHLSQLQEHAAVVEVCAGEVRSCSDEETLQKSVAFSSVTMCAHDGAGVLSAQLSCSYTPSSAGQRIFRAVEPDELADLAGSGAFRTAPGLEGKYFWSTQAPADDFAAMATKAAPNGPTFIAHPNGEVVPVPSGATGPTAVESGKGFQFTGGSGGPGLDPRVTDVRVMDPVTGGKYPYPNGYVSYSNEAGQAVNPATGQTIGKSDPMWHWPWSP